MRLPFLALTILLAGCASEVTTGSTFTTGATVPAIIDSTEEIGTAPQKWREQVATYIRKTFRDPYSLRDAEISAPVQGERLRFEPSKSLGEMSKTYRHKAWVVCFRANAKNGYGGYTGIKQYRAFFRGGKLDDMIEMMGPHAGAECRDARYSPFSLATS